MLIHSASYSVARDFIRINFDCMNKWVLKVVILFLFLGWQTVSAKSTLSMEEGRNGTWFIVDDPINEHYKAALASYENKDLASALVSIRLAIDTNRDNPIFWNLFLDISREMGDAEAVVEALEELIRLNPEDQQLYFDKAYMLTYMGDVEEAMAIYDLMDQRFGRLEQVATSRANIYQSRDDYVSAVHELESFIENEQVETVVTYAMLAELYTKSERGTNALTLLNKAEQLFPNQPLIWLSKADAYRVLGQDQEAFAQLKRAFESDQFDMDTKAGILYNSVTQNVLDEESLTFLADQYVMMYPSEAKAHAVRGDVYAQLNQFEEANSSYKKALEIDRNVPPIWMQLLQIALYYGDVKDAQLIGAEASMLFPRNTEILFYTGNAFLMDNQHTDARRYLELALNSADPRNEALLSQIYGVLGGVYNGLGMYAESDVAFQEALEIDSINVFVLNNYAYYLAERNVKLEQAEVMSRKSLSLQPNESTYEDTYAWILFKMGRYDEALVWIKNAISNSISPSATLLDHYGDILYKNGQVKEAVKQWKNAGKQGGLDEESSLLLSRKIDEKRIVD